MYKKLNINYSLLEDKAFKLFMEDKEIAKIIIEILLNKKIEKLEEVSTEKEIVGLDMERTIRYDVLCKDEKEKYYDVELQVARQEDLMERFRIYQSILDKHTIRKGEKEYIKVRETYIIFICDFDFFEDNLSVYNIKNICIENNKICEDKSNKIIINLKGNTEEREELKELVRLFKNSEYDVNNNQISKLAKRLEDIGNDEKFYGRYDVMQTIEGRLLEKGRAEGIKEGVEKVLISQVKVLKEFNVPEEEIKERIIKEFKLTKEEIEKYFK